MVLSEDSFERDLLRYNELLKRSEELEKDMPSRRTVREKREPPQVKKRVAKVKKPSKAPTRKNPTRKTRTQGEKVSKKEPEESPRLKLPKPAYMTTPSVTAPLKKEMNRSWLRMKAKSFEDIVVVNSTYSDLIRSVTNAGDGTIDFGMRHGLVPKNLEYEKKRFEFDSASVFDSILNRRPSFSDDIDRFFRQLSANSFEQAPNEVPLV
ncbi:hypothetical_protein [Candidozyma auris]|uniref:hypothetical_protein n=1 Tax=Candidozyma auris TaxID=498019 RepID=UPI000D2A609E|nr:hypothetical_protein [[Candida] auris]QEO20367.1 hypothetical_protein [[Candida] auris]GBL49662.1 hypothetical protein CAJCM15448_19360 [[Candida] auris]